MRKILSTIALSFMMLLLLSITSFAQEVQNECQEDVVQWLEPAAGDWYSTKGNFVMTVQGDCINGCKVVSAKDCTYDYPRTGTFQVTEANGNRDMKLDLFGNNIHQYLVVDDKMALRRSIHPEYNESVSGVYLGMTKADYLLHNPQSTNIVADQGNERWEYDADKYAVTFKTNIIVAMRLYKGCTRHFDKSGLGANDTAAAYAQAYGLSETPAVPETKGNVSPAYKTGHGEFLFFSPDYVEMSVYRR